MKTKSLHKVNINGTDQWVLVQGQKNAPLIIHVQAGPGLPMISEARTMGKMLQLEQNFLVAYWDERGCGKSFSKNTDPKTISFRQITDDLINCTKYLLKKYDKKTATLIGYSMGASIALMAAKEESHLFSQLFLVGVDIDLAQATEYTRDFFTVTAKESGKSKWIRQANELKHTPILETKAFQKRAKLLTNLRGVNTKTDYNQLLFGSIKNMIRSKEYRLSDIPKTIKGMAVSQNALLPEFNLINLFTQVESVNTPVHFIQGKKDGIAPFHIAVDYFNHLLAPAKSFTAFEESAHMPHYEEPVKFATLIREKLSNII